jgi:CHASE2 domain-containing sensor protein
VPSVAPFTPNQELGKYFKDRVVFIGISNSEGPSGIDIHYSSYSNDQIFGLNESIYGVEILATLQSNQVFGPRGDG